AQVTEIVAGWAGHDAVTKRGEERAGVEPLERGDRVEVVGACPSDCGRVGNRSGCRAVAVDAVGARAEDSKRIVRVVRQIERGLQDELLVAPAAARMVAELQGHV